MVRIGCSVISGLEQVAVEEIRERLGGAEAAIDEHRGKVYLQAPSEAAGVRRLKELRSVEHVFCVVGSETSDRLVVGGDRDRRLGGAEAAYFKHRLPTLFDWAQALQVWAVYSESQFSVDELLRKHDPPPPPPPASPSEAQREEMVNGGRKRRLPGVPAFRVTATRAGAPNVAGAASGDGERVGHHFTSEEVARWVGAGVNDRFGWQPNMKNFELEVLVFVYANTVTLSLALTATALHNRNLRCFGPTTLKSTISFALARLCELAPGDVVMDPMCGSGSVPIEAATYLSRRVFSLASDLAHIPTDRTAENARQCAKHSFDSLYLDVCRSDITNAPFKAQCCDVIITDMPFGKRMGSRENNWTLYPRVLCECGRLARARTGRAAFLTQDKRNFMSGLNKNKHLWALNKQIHINMGGIIAAIFVLSRTKNPFSVSQAVERCCNRRRPTNSAPSNQSPPPLSEPPSNGNAKE